MMRGTTEPGVSEMTRGTTAAVACRVIREIAGRGNRHMTGVVTRSAADRLAGEAAEEAQRGIADEVVLRRMYDTVV